MCGSRKFLIVWGCSEMVSGFGILMQFLLAVMFFKLQFRIDYRHIGWRQ